MSRHWSWIAGGVALGLLNLLIFISGNHLGTATAYAQTAGYLTQFFTTKLVPAGSWTAGTCGGGGALQAGWQWFLVLGIFLGARPAGCFTGPSPSEAFPACGPHASAIGRAAAGDPGVVLGYFHKIVGTPGALHPLESYWGRVTSPVFARCAA